MKKNLKLIMTLTVFLSGTFWLPAENNDMGNTSTISWVNDLKKARAMAKVEKKPLFVMFRCEP